MPKALHPDLREQAKQLFIMGIPVVRIADKIGVSKVCINKWRERDKWGIIRKRAKEAVSEEGAISLEMEVSSDLRLHSQKLKEQLSNEILRQVGLLAESPAKNVADLASNGKRQGRAAVVKTVIESASKLHNWEGEHSTTLVNVVLQSGDADVVKDDAIEIETVVTRETAQETE